jgi:hypothetical protein
VPRVQIALVYRPIAPTRSPQRVVLNCTPEIRDHAIRVVHDFEPRLVWPREQHCERSRERLKVQVRITEGAPDQICDA